MKEQDVFEGIASDDFANDLDELDRLDDELDKAMPDWDRWNDELKQLLPEKERREDKPSGRPKAVSEKRPADANTDPDRRESKQEAPPSGLNDLITSDKQLLFFIQKYREADRICQEAGISLQTLQKKVGQLSYRLKRYIDVRGLYRETKPVKLTSEGIAITKHHLLESGFKIGDRFKIGFKGKYIILSKIGQ